MTIESQFTRKLLNSQGKKGSIKKCTLYCCPAGITVGLETAPSLTLLLELGEQSCSLVLHQAWSLIPPRSMLISHVLSQPLTSPIPLTGLPSTFIPVISFNPVG